MDFPTLTEFKQANAGQLGHNALWRVQNFVQSLIDCAQSVNDMANAYHDDTHYRDRGAVASINHYQNMAQRLCNVLEANGVNLSEIASTLESTCKIEITDARKQAQAWIFEDAEKATPKTCRFGGYLKHILGILRNGGKLRSSTMLQKRDNRTFYAAHFVISSRSYGHEDTSNSIVMIYSNYEHVLTVYMDNVLSSAEFKVVSNNLLKASRPERA